MPLISIVLPTYNHAQFLNVAIKCVLNQTYTNWELIIIDNNSTDNTNEVINKYNDYRIQHVKIDNKGIISSSRNLGIKLSNGDWIAFLDSDDSWHKSKLEIVVNNILLNHNIDVVCSNEHLVDSNHSNNNRILKYGPFSNNFYQKLLIEGNKISTSATVVKASLIRDQLIYFSEDIRFNTVEDYGFWLDLAFVNAQFIFLPDVLGEYLIHGSNSSGKLQTHKENLKNLLSYHIYEKQNFSDNNDEMMKMVMPRIQYIEFQSLIKDRKVTSGLMLVVSELCTNTLNTLIFIYNILIKRL